MVYESLGTELGGSITNTGTKGGGWSLASLSARARGGPRAHAREIVAEGVVAGGSAGSTGRALAGVADGEGRGVSHQTRVAVPPVDVAPPLQKTKSLHVLIGRRLHVPQT